MKVPEINAKFYLFLFSSKINAILDRVKNIPEN